MSHPGKVTLLQEAQRLGYRTYLYFVSTDDPEINWARVQYRVSQGGHAVPKDKLLKRYDGSLQLLMPAIRHSSRAYLFDNSSERRDPIWLAEITEGKELQIQAPHLPRWFKEAVWDKFLPAAP